MAEYTEADLAAIRQAIIKLASGQRVTQIRTANGKSVTYESTDLKQLQQLEAQLKKSLRPPRRRLSYLVTGKGL